MVGEVATLTLESEAKHLDRCSPEPQRKEGRDLKPLEGRGLVWLFETAACRVAQSFITV